MEKNMALVLYYTKHTRFSFNALVGALETKEYFDNFSIYFISRENELISELKNIIKKHEKVIFAISFCTPQLWDTYRLNRKLRETYSNKLLYITGGPHPTGDPMGTLKKLGFDLVVRGEGEETLIELLQKIDENEDYKTVKGIAYISNDGEYHYTGRRALIELDSYPPFAVKHNKFGYIEITRGCPYFCYFCQTPYLFGSQIRHRSVETICKYVKIMKNRNLTFLRFISPSAFSYGSPDGKSLNITQLEKLLIKTKEIFDPGSIFIGSFPSEVRPEHVNEETINLVLKYANNDNLIIGAQSGSQRILDLCHRGHSVKDVYAAVELTVRKGLKANVDFVFGLPEETEDDIELTIKTMSELLKMGNGKVRIHAHTFMPLPLTPFAKKPAGKIDKNIRKMIKKLLSKDIVYGNWREQEKIAKKIENYMKTGEL